MLQVDRISKRFKGDFALNETSFTLNRGVIGLLGPNGAGKTTLLRILATYFEPSGGTISLDKLNWNKNKEDVRRKIGYMPQHIGIFPHLKVSEYLHYIGILRGMTIEQIKEREKKILAEVNLEDKSNIKIKNLSGGMKQRVGIAQALLHDPQLLLVDEPTAGLDPEERIRFRNLIKRLSQDRIVIFSTHITEDITMTSNEILLMNRGNVRKYDNVQAVVDIAKDKVWVLTTDLETYNIIREQQKFFISNIKESINDGTVELRIICDVKPHPLAYQTKPTLEEGYMVWLQKN